MSTRYTTARIPYARARGASSSMTGTYDGADLAPRSSRPGAYDAMNLPSLMNGKRHTRGAVEPAAVPPTAAPSPRAFIADREAPPLPEIPMPEPATHEAEARLEELKATLALWQSYVDALQARLAFDALVRRLRPFIQPKDMPAI